MSNMTAFRMAQARANKLEESRKSFNDTITMMIPTTTVQFVAMYLEKVELERNQAQKKLSAMQEFLLDAYPDAMEEFDKFYGQTVVE